MKSFSLVYQRGPVVVASDGTDYIRCYQYDNGTFHRSTGQGACVQSPSLDYIAIGAKRYGSLTEAMGDI